MQLRSFLTTDEHQWTRIRKPSTTPENGSPKWVPSPRLGKTTFLHLIRVNPCPSVVSIESFRLRSKCHACAAIGAEQKAGAAILGLEQRPLERSGLARGRIDHAAAEQPARRRD